MRWSFLRLPFLPAIAVMNRLTFARKFILIGLLTCAPLFILAYLQYTSSSDRIDFNRRELLGVEYLTSLSDFLHNVQLHRVLAATASGGDRASPKLADDAARAADVAAEKMAQTDARLGEILQTTSLWNGTRTAWDLLKSQSGTPEEIDKAHSALCERRVRALLHQVGNNSNLILDPDLDSFWLMDALVMKLPALSDAVAGAAATVLYGNEGSRQAAAEADSLLERAAAEDLVDVNMGTAFRQPKSSSDGVNLRDRLGRLAVHARTEALAHADLIRDSSGARGEPGADELRTASLKALAAFDALGASVRPELSRLIANRVSAFQGKRLQGLVAAIAVALVLTYLLVAIYLSVRRSMSAIQASGTPLASSPMTPASQDELGELAAAYTQARTEQSRLEEQLRLADRLATIGTLAAGTAHELNEPLGAVLGFAQLAAKSPDLPDATVRDLDKITKAALHAREVIRKLMLFARQTRPDKRPIDLHQVVEEALGLVASRFDESGIILKRQFDDVGSIVADASQLRQVVLNLVVNALQASNRGGEVRVSLASTGAYLRLVVEDDGEGMTDEVREKVFLPFYTTKEIGQGTGLGLSVVHGIVTSHGGTIQLRSAPGHGTRFEVLLPMGEQLDNAE